MSRPFQVLAILLLALPMSAQTNDSAPIRRVLDDQVAAWNRRDLEGFMAGYWNSPELTFFSANTVTRGWQATLARYRQRYQSAGSEMGQLEFRDLRIELLGENAAFVRGRYHLALKDGKESVGLFTLIFRKLPEGWKIVHDHTSSAPEP